MALQKYVPYKHVLLNQMSFKIKWNSLFLKQLVYTSIKLLMEILLDRNKGTVTDKFKAIRKQFLSGKCTFLCKCTKITRIP
jgi:hypothetical protein